MAIPYHLDWVSCTIGLVGVYFVGRKLWWGWLFHVANLIPLTIINAHYKLWGFMPMNVILLVLYLKSMRDWLKDGQTTNNAA